MAIKRLKPINSLNDLKLKIEKQLNETSWWMLSDSQLTETQLATAAQWRSDMMNVLSDRTVQEGIIEYLRLMGSKPGWSL